VSAPEPNDLSANRQLVGTQFFSPKLDIRYLEQEAIPAIFRTKRAGDQVRVWAMDCGRGATAYSLAMLFCEANNALAAPLQIAVFATDMDPHNLAVARHGRFDKAAVCDMSADRLARWFVSDEHGCTVSKELRATCTFSLHAVTQDVPFSHIDLIYCGDVLRGLPPSLRTKVVSLLHFSLRAEGYLLLGGDEDISSHARLFARAEGAGVTYRRLPGGRRFFPAFPLSLQAGAAPDGLDDLASAAPPEIRQSEHVHWLERELRWTKDQLRATIDQLRASNRTLQFSNEEYQSLNEELRSTNEELRASKAELQSVNKKLETVNGELFRPLAELRKTNCDLRNLLDSTRIGTLFVDRQLRITRITPTIAEIFHVIESDIGRCITDIACELPYDALADDVALAIHALRVVERKLINPQSGAHYLVRVLPYRDPNDVIAGAVLTFLDITGVMQAEEALRSSEARFHAVVRSVPAALFMADAAMEWIYVNPRFYEFTGLAETTAIGTGWLAAVHPADREEVERRLARARLYNSGFEHEVRLCHAAGGYRWYLLRAIENAADGDLTGWTGSLLDIHDRHAAETQQRLLFIELQRRVKAILGAVRSVAGHTKGSSVSLDDFFDHFDGRLAAIARAQSSIARGADFGVDLEQLLSEEILTHATGCDDRVTLSGAALRVGERLGQALGLAIHELTTNALKYGALAKSTGSVEVSWRLVGGEDAQRVHLEWKEHTVAVIDINPRRVGFGRGFLDKRLAVELDASTSLEFGAGGIRFTIDFPLLGFRSDGGEP
jgi:two-component system, chemotaxis family, CheB/CheR fusion protein